MMNLKPSLLVLLILFFVTFSTLQTNICLGANPSSPIANNLYSSVVLITQKKLKVPIWELLGPTTLFTSLGAAQGVKAIPLPPVSVSSPPAHGSFGIIREIGTGFQTNWGVVTSSHVMNGKAKAVLTTFHRKHYSIKKINTTKHKGKYKHLPIHRRRVYQDAKLIQAKTKEATVYDWGGMGIDMALVYVKIPGAFPLPLANEVKIGEQIITLGHPKGKKSTTSEIGTIKSIYKRNNTKHIKLSIQRHGGMSGSPVLNMKGEVVGIIRVDLDGPGASEAVHVEELRMAFGLSDYKLLKNKYSPDKKQKKVFKKEPTTVFATNASNIFHKQDCSKLNASDGLIKFDTSQEASKAGGLPCCHCKP
jgi:hypothetical protein